MALVASAFALAQSAPKDDAGRIIALEHAWNRAIEAKDTRALDQLLGPTFVAVATDGTLTRKASFSPASKILLISLPKPSMRISARKSTVTPPSPWASFVSEKLEKASASPNVSALSTLGSEGANPGSA
jgi:hypothetical protein